MLASWRMQGSDLAERPSDTVAIAIGWSSSGEVG